MENCLSNARRLSRSLEATGWYTCVSEIHHPVPSYRAAAAAAASDISHRVKGSIASADITHRMKDAMASAKGKLSGPAPSVPAAGPALSLIHI